MGSWLNFSMSCFSRIWYRNEPKVIISTHLDKLIAGWIREKTYCYISWVLSSANSSMLIKMVVFTRSFSTYWMPYSYVIFESLMCSQHSQVDTSIQTQRSLNCLRFPSGTERAKRLLRVNQFRSLLYICHLTKLNTEAEHNKSSKTEKLAPFSNAIAQGITNIDIS